MALPVWDLTRVDHPVSFRLLVNPAAANGRALRRLPKVTDELQRLGVDPVVIQTRSLEHAREEAAEVAREGGTLGAMGGDGFVRPLAGALRDSAARLAVLPGGRGNDFARALGIPRDPAEAAQVAVSGRERLVDVGFVGDEPFLGIASYGIDSDVPAPGQQHQGRARQPRLPVRRPAGAEGVAGRELQRGGRRRAAHLRGLSPPRWPTPACSAAAWRCCRWPRSTTGSSTCSSPRATPSGATARGLTQVFSGKHLDPRFTEVLRASEVEIDSAPPYDVFADGDPIGRTPARVTVEPRCLRVLVPA